MAKRSTGKKTARDGQQTSIWQQISLNSHHTPHHEEPLYDVVIVGAGITGITTALLLQQAGRKCLLAEGHNYGFGTTGGTSAHLNTFFDATYPEIESDFGKEAAKLVAKAGKQAKQMIYDFVKTYHIDCDLETKEAYLFSQTEKESQELAKLLESSKAAGIAVEEVDKNGVPIDFEQVLLFKDQGQFHPLKYITGLLSEFKKLGGVFQDQTFIEKTSYEEGVYTITSAQLTFRAKKLVYATHIPPGVNLLSLRCAPYRSYVLAVKLSDGAAYPNCLAYDMKEPYHYFRSHEIDGEPYLIIGGEDHKTGHGDPEEAFKNLEAYARKYFKIKSIPYKWSAQYYVPVDGLPYIGKMPMGHEHTYIATGFNGNGMMFGTLAGKIITDLILGRKNSYQDLFDPGRLKPIAGFSEFVKENADVAYHFIADRISIKNINTLGEIKKGTGLVVDIDHQKLAIYKNSAGKLKALNPVCTHAGCIVGFNPVEKSWDCPCHGGRFDLNGKVISGPPQKDLDMIDIEEI